MTNGSGQGHQGDGTPDPPEGSDAIESQEETAPVAPSADDGLEGNAVESPLMDDELEERNAIMASELEAAESKPGAALAEHAPDEDTAPSPTPVDGDDDELAAVLSSEPETIARDPADMSDLLDDSLKDTIDGTTVEGYPGDYTEAEVDETDDGGEWQRMGTQPRYQPPVDRGEVPQPPERFPKSDTPRYREPTQPIGRIKLGRTENVRPSSVRQATSPPRRPGSRRAERATHDAVTMEIEGSEAVTEELALEEHQLPELEPFELAKPAKQSASRELPPESPLFHPSASYVAVLRSEDGTSPYTALTLDLASVSSLSASALSQVPRRYLEKIYWRRPGPGGIGFIEETAAGRKMSKRLPDVRLPARILPQRPPTGRDPAQTPKDVTALAPAIVEGLAKAPHLPVMVVGQPGSGKSHACASLAAALADLLLQRTDASNVFSGLANALSSDGAPIPVLLDMAAVATLAPSDVESFLRTYTRQGDLPADLITYEGPTVVICDNLEVALQLGPATFDPIAILRTLLQQRPRWRALIATRPVSAELLGALHGFGVEIIEVLPMRSEQISQMMAAWLDGEEDLAPDIEYLQALVPATVAQNPRLLQMLLGHWSMISDQLQRAVQDGGVSGVCRLILEAGYELAETRAGSVTHRQDLQVLAEVIGGLDTGYLHFQDVRDLIMEGYLKDELGTLVSTGFVETRMAKGDRPVGALSFTHPLLQEVLLAEHVVSDIVRTGLVRGLKARARELEPAAPVVPYSERQVLRIIEVADSRARDLQEHLKPDLLYSLEDWLRSALAKQTPPTSPHYPRMVGVAWLVARALRKTSAQPAEPEGKPIDRDTMARALALLSRAHEDALHDAIEADWTAQHAERTASGQHIAVVDDSGS